MEEPGVAFRNSCVNWASDPPRRGGETSVWKTAGSGSRECLLRKMGLTIMKGETWRVVAETAEVMGYREEADPKGNGTQETSQPQSRCSGAGVQGAQGCTG